MPGIHYVKIDDLKTHPEKKLSVPDLAEYWGVGDSTIYRLTSKGALPCTRVGRRVIIDREAAVIFEETSGRPSDEHLNGQAR